VTLLATLSQRDSKNFFKFKIILFGDTFLVTLFHRSIDRAILLVTLFDPSQFGDTLCVFHFQKKNNDKKKKRPPYLVTLFLVTLFPFLLPQKSILEHSN
jgi:hypothetical protein